MPDDPYKYFRAEASDLIDQLSRGVLELENGGGSAEIVPRLLRVAHTLKGAARVVKLREIADAAHTIEGCLAPFRDTTAPIPQDRLESVLRLVDVIATSVGTLTQRVSDASASPRQAPDSVARTVRAEVSEMDELLDGMSEASAQLASVRDAAQSLSRARHVAHVLAEQLSVPTVRSTLPGTEGLAAVKTGALAAELQGLMVRIERTFTRGIDQIDQELRQVHDTAQRLRLLPASSVFAALERTARDVAQSTGKRVVFGRVGGDVRLDAHVLDTVQGALVQLVRNAVAHGVEPEPTRLAAHKPPEGHVWIEVILRGTRVAFRCRDDGRGLDVDAIRLAAQRKGVLSAETDRLGSADLLRVLLRGGISTSGVVSEIAGRGIGLDVVREAVERLDGEIRVDTTPGGGTAIELVVPVSLSSMETLLVESDGVCAAVPLEKVRHTLRIGAEHIARTPDGDTVVYDGTVMPFLPLSRVLGGRRAGQRPDMSWSGVILDGGDGVTAIGVDRLLGTATVVLRALPELAPGDPIIAGASLDVEGNPQLVLDVQALSSYARRGHPAENAVRPARRPILIIDDSPTTRMLEQSILEAAGFEADVASSAEEALDKAHRRTYGLFLVDVEMPGMDGFTFVQQTRGDARLRDIPAILVTSRSAPEDRRRGEEVGASAYIVKGEFDQSDFLERVRKLAG